MYFRALVTTILLLSATSNANAVNIYFSFSNVTGDVPGTVSGEIFGLIDNATSSASDILITSVPAELLAGGLPAIPFSVFDYANIQGHPVVFNSFTLSNGVVTDAVFQIFGGSFDLNLQPSPNAPYYNRLIALNPPYPMVANLDGFEVVTFTAAPEPASMALFATGILGLAGLRRCRTSAK